MKERPSATLFAYRKGLERAQYLQELADYERSICFNRESPCPERPCEHVEMLEKCLNDYKQTM